MKLGLLKLDCPSAVSEQIVSITTCPCLENSTMSLIEVSLINHTGCTDTSCGSLDTEPVSWFWFADPHFVVLSYRKKNIDIKQ